MRKLIFIAIFGAVVMWMWPKAHRQAETQPLTTRSTFNPGIQQIAEDLFREQKGTIIAANHGTDEILAYVDSTELQASRKPLSSRTALNPFLYAMAIDRGYTGASFLPGSTNTWVTLREGLSQNLPRSAEHLLSQFGSQALALRLQDMELKDQGNLSLLDLVTAYATLARGGRYRPLQSLHAERLYTDKQIFSPESAAIVSDILSRAENKDVLMPEHTVLFSGHSPHDAWAIVYNFKFIVGVWLNTGKSSVESQAAIVPAQVARELMNRVIAPERLEPLPLNGNIRARRLCRKGLRLYEADGKCVGWMELMPGKAAKPSSDKQNLLNLENR